jgi:hypothetical protein
VCGRSSLIPRFGWFDWVLVAMAMTGAWFEISGLSATMRNGQAITTYDVLAAADGPLLVVLVIEGNLVKRFMMALGSGLIARCWTSFVAGITMVILGHIGVGLAAHGYMPPALAGTIWYTLFLGPTAMAMGPAWQLEAIQSACGEVGVPKFSPFASSLAALRLLNTKAV